MRIVNVQGGSEKMYWMRSVQREPTQQTDDDHEPARTRTGRSKRKTDRTKRGTSLNYITSRKRICALPSLFRLLLTTIPFISYQ